MNQSCFILFINPSTITFIGWLSYFVQLFMFMNQSDSIKVLAYHNMGYIIFFLIKLSNCVIITSKAKLKVDLNVYFNLNRLICFSNVTNLIISHLNLITILIVHIISIFSNFLSFSILLIQSTFSILLNLSNISIFSSVSIESIFSI